MRPVFWGFKEYGPNEGAPAPLRLFYPTLDGAVDGPVLLKGCGRYPLVVFLHGHCQGGGSEHYKSWELLGAVLARSGYIVAAPQILDIASAPTADLLRSGMLNQLVTWLRSAWEHKDVLLPAPSTAFVGHSYGGALGARFATTFGGVAALASLHTGWQHDAGNAAPLLGGLTIPKLFIMGDNDVFSLISEPFWNSIPSPKHKANFREADHWDYLPRSPQNCGTKSSCPEYPAAALAILAMFLGKYLPPELATDLPSSIPDSLRPPTPLNLTTDQEFFAGGTWLQEIDRMEQGSACHVALDYVTPNTRVVPFVRDLPPGRAAERIRAEDLVPKFTNETGDFVFRQHPFPGTRVQVGSTVTMTLRKGQPL